MIENDSLPDWTSMNDLALPVPIPIDGKIAIPDFGQTITAATD